MKRLLFLAVFSMLSGLLSAQLNMTLRSHIDYQATRNSGCSNIWGYVDENNNEYAIVGLNKGTSIVDVTDPNNPVEVFFIPDSNSIWREVKIWHDYAYVTTEEAVGVMIIDLSPLPASTTLPVYRFYGNGGPSFTRAHSLFIDENGILYINGANRGNQGVIFYDLNVSPTNPPEVGMYDVYYVHDSYARGDTLYAAHIYDGFFQVIDISTKSNPIVLAQQVTPMAFTHNCWISNDGDALFATDEVGGAPISAYDISDLGNIREIDQIKSNPGSNSIPHNVLYRDGYLVTSYYRDGVVIHDAADPANLIEVGNYDVSPLTGNGFNSIWGAFPYFPSGTIVASDIENGLYVFTPNYVRGCYLHGMVRNQVSNDPIANAQIAILNHPIVTSSLINGIYKTGIVSPGSYDIVFYKPGFEPDTVYNVNLIAGDTVFANGFLNPLNPITVTGQVLEQITNAPIQGAIVVFRNQDFLFTTTTDAAGNYILSDMMAGTYDFSAGHWGHWNQCEENVSFTASINSKNASLKKGYYDDFRLNFGWTSIDNAVSGNWVREIPIATGLPDGTPTNPHFDVDTDCGKEAFITGNQLGTYTAADVDGGPAVLISPVFDATQYTDPWLAYYRWFFIRNTPWAPNDTLFIYLSNGMDTVLLEAVHFFNTDLSQWIEVGFPISSFITPTANMRMILSIEDDQSLGYHILEAGLDRFYVSEGDQLSDGTVENKNGIRLFPNPNNGQFSVEMLNGSQIGNWSIFDVNGRLIQAGNTEHSRLTLSDTGIEDGLYLFLTENGEALRLMIVR